MKCAITAMVLHIFEWAKTHKDVIPLILRKHTSMNSLDGRRAIVRHLMDKDNVHDDFEDNLMQDPQFEPEIETMANTLSMFRHE